MNQRDKDSIEYYPTTPNGKIISMWDRHTNVMYTMSTDGVATMRLLINGATKAFNIKSISYLTYK